MACVFLSKKKRRAFFNKTNGVRFLTKKNNVHVCAMALLGHRTLERRREYSKDHEKHFKILRLLSYEEVFEEP